MALFKILLHGIFLISSLSLTSFARNLDSAANVLSSNSNKSALKFASIAISTQPNLIVCESNKSEDSCVIFLAVGSKISIDNRMYYNVTSWKGPFVIPSVKTISGIVGVVFDHIGGPKSNDLVLLYMRTPRVLEYVIGFGISFTSSHLIAQKWSSSFAVPARLSDFSTASVSIHIRTTLKNRKDMVIAFEKNSRIASYAIGRNIDSHGSALSGWARHQLFPSPSSASSTTITVVQKLFANCKVNLSFGQQWGTFFISLGISEEKNKMDVFSTRRIIRLSDVHINHLLLKVDSLAASKISDREGVSPTFLQNSSENFISSDQSKVHLGPMETAKEMLTQGGNYHGAANRADACLKCYEEAGLSACIEHVNTCESVQEQNSSQADGNDKTNPNFEKAHIFCYGFDTILNRQRQNICNYTYTLDYVFSVGVTTILQEILTEDFMVESAEDNTVNVTMSISYINVPVNKSFAKVSGTIRPPPNSVSVRIRSQHTLRALLIDQAVQELRKKSDFGSFLNGNWDIRKIGDGVFLVSFTFSSDFQDEYIVHPREMIY